MTQPTTKAEWEAADKQVREAEAEMLTAEAEKLAATQRVWATTRTLRIALERRRALGPEPRE